MRMDRCWPLYAMPDVMCDTLYKWLKASFDGRLMTFLKVDSPLPVMTRETTGSRLCTFLGGIDMGAWGIGKSLKQEFSSS